MRERSLRGEWGLIPIWLKYGFLTMRVLISEKNKGDLDGIP